jgi:hypothetical protein
MKKQYGRPTVHVVKLHHQVQLLYGSPTGNLGNPQSPLNQNWDDNE